MELKTQQTDSTTDKKHQAQIFTYAMVSFIIELTIPKGCQIKNQKRRLWRLKKKEQLEAIKNSQQKNTQ